MLELMWWGPEYRAGLAAGCEAARLTRSETGESSWGHWLTPWSPSPKHMQGTAILSRLKKKDLFMCMYLHALMCAPSTHLYAPPARTYVRHLHAFVCHLHALICATCAHLSVPPARTYVRPLHALTYATCTYLCIPPACTYVRHLHALMCATCTHLCAPPVCKCIPQSKRGVGLCGTAAAGSCT